MSDFSNRYLVPTFNGLVAQIGLSLGISIVCTGFFEWNRRKKTLEYLYSPRCRLSVDPSPPVSLRFMGWVMPTVRMPEEFYINNVGLDAVMFLRFLRMCLQFCIFNGIVVGCILLPIHYHAGGTLTEVPRMSIMNVPNESHLLWAHVFLTYLITVSWMFLLFKNYWQWMDLRREYTLQRIRQGEIAERSVFISRLPSNLRSDASLRQYFESLKMGPVESATVVQHCGRLSQKIDRREGALNMLEKAHIELARSVLASIKAGTFQQTSGPAEAFDDKSANAASTAPVVSYRTNCHDNTDDISKDKKPTNEADNNNNRAATVDYATLQKVAKDLFSDKKRYKKARKSIFAKKRYVRTIDISTKQRAAQEHSKDASPLVKLSSIRSDSIDIVVQPKDVGPKDIEPETQDPRITAPDLVSAPWTVWATLAKVQRQHLDSFQPKKPEKRFKGGPRIHSIDYFVKKYNRLDRKVEELRDGSLRYKSTSFGFVTFKHYLSAQLCAQSKIDSRPQGLSVCLAMEPRDVLWSNLTASFRNRFTRSIAVNLSIWALIVFWIFPTSSFLLLTSLGALSSRFTFLQPVLEASPLIQSLLQNVLPIVFVTIFLALAPVIIVAISKQGLPVSYSALEGNVLRRYYHFLIFNVLFVFMIGTAILKSIITLIQKPTNIFTLLAESLPSGSTFFVFYIVFNTCTHFLELVQVWAQLVIHAFVTARKFTQTPRALQRAITPWCFQFYYYYPQNILAMVITLIYSIINPLILLAAVFYFGFALLIFKYQFAYCYIRKYERSGRYFRHVFQYTSDGLIIFQVTMIGVLWLKEAIVGGFFIVALLGMTVYFKMVCGDLFRSRTKFLPLDTGLRSLDSDVLDTCQGEEPRASVSSRSSVHDSNIRKRHSASTGSLGSGMDVEMDRTAPPSPRGVVLEASESKTSNMGQPRTFSRLRVAAGQSDRYRKLLHSDSAEEVSRGNSCELLQTGSLTAAPQGEGSTVEKQEDEYFEHRERPRTSVYGNFDSKSAVDDILDDTVPMSTILSEERAEFGDGFMAGNGYFTNPVGPYQPLYVCRDPASHFEHATSRIRYQDRTSEYETYIHPALLKPLNRQLWLPNNPLYDHWDLDDTTEINFALSSSSANEKVVFRTKEVDGVLQSPRSPYDQELRRYAAGSAFDREAGLASHSKAVWEGCLNDSDLQ
ncbi:hypothetical protein BGZ72_009909 [Mortierella alpina]|nr:hypothetical protein BGZ72_009909 [Mortierella alpina]